MNEEFIFLGTGTSEGIPRIPANCIVCQDAANPFSKNRRRNTSLVIRVWNEKDARLKNIIIDCGKFFWDSAIQWFPKFGIRFIDAVFLTHQHNDACYGLDDLRDWTNNVKENKIIPIYLRKQDLEFLSKPFDYLVDTNKVTPGGGVSKLEYNILDPKNPFEVEGLKIIPIEVEHGSTIFLGFRFADVVYLSDVSKISEESEKKIIGCKILVLDMLRMSEKHPSHFIWEESLEVAKKLKPPKVYFVGMNHSVNHEEVNQLLSEFSKKEGIDVELAYDGLRVPWNFN